MQKKKIMLAYLLTLLSGNMKAMNCVTIADGSNLWRLVANVGTCLNTFTPIVLSDLDTITSVVDDIQEDLFSISDVLGSKIMKVDTDLLSISDVIISGIESVIVSQIEGLTSVIEDIHEDLYSESDIIQSNIMQLDAEVLSVGDGLESQLDIIETTYACVFGTAITQADLPITISSPGIYRLCGDASFTSNTFSAITIASNDVVLDLNSYNLNFTSTSQFISAILLNSGTNVIIRNGTISLGNTGSGIEINSVQFSNAYVRDITILGASQLTSLGIKGLNSTDFIVENCQINQVGGGILIDGCSQFVVKGCVVTDAGIAGIQTSPGNAPSSEGEILQCTVFTAGSFAFAVQTPTTEIYLRECSAFSSGFGFFIGSTSGPSGSGIVLQDCAAFANTSDGFFLGSDGVTLERCIATQNGNNGFDGLNNTRGPFTGLVIRDCIANSNTADGFDSNYNDALLEGCTAVNNGATGFDVRNTSGTATVSIRESSAVGNGGIGFRLTMAAGIVIKDCFATHNGSSGITDGSLAQVILDTRSFNNGAADVVGSSTVITY